MQRATTRGLKSKQKQVDCEGESNPQGWISLVFAPLTWRQAPVPQLCKDSTRGQHEKTCIYGPKSGKTGPIVQRKCEEPLLLLLLIFSFRDFPLLLVLRTAKTQRKTTSDQRTQKKRPWEWGVGADSGREKVRKGFLNSVYGPNCLGSSPPMHAWDRPKTA